MCYTRRWDREEDVQGRRRIRDLFARESEPSEPPVPVSEPSREEEVEEAREREPVGAGA